MKQKIKLKRWKPRCGETFYYITQSGTISGTRANRGRSTVFKMATGNYFKTPTMARKVLKKILDELGLPYFSWGSLELMEHPIERGKEVSENYIPESQYDKRR